MSEQYTNPEILVSGHFVVNTVIELGGSQQTIASIDVSSSYVNAHSLLKVKYTIMAVEALKLVYHYTDTSSGGIQLILL